MALVPLQQLKYGLALRSDFEAYLLEATSGPVSHSLELL
jgi:hypothetical protein